MSLKNKKAIIWIAVVAALLLLVVAPVLLVVRPAQLEPNAIEITEDDVENLTGAISRLTSALTGKANRNQRMIRVKFSENEKRAMLKLVSLQAKKPLADHRLAGVLDSRNQLLLWQMEYKLALGVLPVKANFLVAIRDGRITMNFKEIKVGVIPVPGSYLPEISTMATAEINRDESAAQLAKMLHQVTFDPDGSMEIVIDRRAAGQLINSLIPY